jgi:DNA-binding transcriptional LysR family regulator
MLERHLLRYFLAVIDTGTFSGAAELCRVSQPTVSSGIARLESEVGVSLFIRTSRRVELTAAGARLLPHARRIESEFVEAQGAVAEVPPAMHVRLGVASTIATPMVEAIVAAAIAPGDLRLEIIERRPGELAALLDRGRVDLTLGPLGPHSRQPVTELFGEPYLLAVPVGHPLAAEPMVSCEQLVGETMLVRRHCEVLPMVSQFFTARGIRPFMAARSFSEERVLAYVRAGLGVTVMPESLACEGVTVVPLAGFDSRRMVGFTLDPASQPRVLRSGLIDQARAAMDSLS